MGYESWSPELQGSAQSRPIPLGPEHAGTMVPPWFQIETQDSCRKIIKKLRRITLGSSD